MREKLTTLAKAAQKIQDGMLIASGGNSLVRSPVAFGIELAKLKRKNLKHCAAAPGLLADILCADGAIDTIYFGFTSFETEYGLAVGMRKGVQSGEIRPIEGACAAIIEALKAGAKGVPFHPVAGMWGSDLIEANPDFYFVTESPIDKVKVVCVKALVPDYAIVHVHEADIYGNARILGPEFQDKIMSRAAKHTIITTERIVDTQTFIDRPKETTIPHFLVDAVVHAPKGAKPGTCYNEYEFPDASLMNAYLKAVKENGLPAYIVQYQKEGVLI